MGEGMRVSVPFGMRMTLAPRPARARALYAAFAAATLMWALLLPLVPFLASRAHASPAGTALVVAIYAAGSIICHQLPTRSFQLWTAQMPVCARCTGIYVGTALAVVSFGARAFQASGSLGRRSAEGRALQRLSGPRLTLALAAAPTLATLVFEWTTGRTPANSIRFAAGVPVGAAVAWLVRTAAGNQVN
jgi:uncharacterized membrane protein